MTVEYAIDAMIQCGQNFDLINTVAEFYHYKQRRIASNNDPIHHLFICIFVQFDFKEAGKYLAESVEFIKSDETLAPKLKDFVDSAKRVFLERYFGIHHKVSIEIVANAMQTSVEETKRLIEELIATKKLTGKFDETGMV
ncbi:hypothetical protein ACOME3_000878, partial [Neoechinorhynchus agilis]